MKVIYVDIDNTICYLLNKTDYTTAIPYKKRIAKINELYTKGNQIIYWTARGTVTGINWENITLDQLKKWECKYHRLEMGKPFYDLFIDDKNINSERFFQERLLSEANNVVNLLNSSS